MRENQDDPESLEQQKVRKTQKILPKIYLRRNL
jgi:hypothetical protein